MKRLILAAGLCAAVLAPSAARAQDQRETMVRSLVTQITPTLQERGFSQSGSTTVGQLAASADG
ncbi:MAG TPA: hypothetical protein VFH27_04440, partial [Longimicrobiaceae bacterium]|nr:hypothetical protein [Longimicrobiaceae bacterium]